ncbi:hypothetical protein Pla52o_43730 [Novipirellula galeiformis]|uniref:Uncharacterized protein n=1 Tax=Novipirellula galeiformis TaxID=2528004 RepID=A0A5C6C8T4_9BACT|nr:hypothetical protein [Novipirellula galeiformis]TWU20495.1 hypothetical protein Pla52o_43730 [Novipirellula galeiformis]
MIVPEFWAESRIQKRDSERQITVRRFGWSNTSVEEAQRHADDRVRDALDRIVRGETLPRRELKVRYNGADGLPIREEVIERFGEHVVSRNSYGARCLNTPDVFFADVDFQATEPDSCTTFLISMGFSILVAIAVGLQLESLAKGILVLPIAATAIHLLLHWIHRISITLRGGHEPIALRRFDHFTRTHPEWHLRIYRTPNGFRVLAMHATFDPRSSQVDAAFKSLGVDRTYAVMCQKQNCFRARLTAKPWRIGIVDHLKPRPGVWPIKQTQIPVRHAWVEKYEATAANYAACRFVKAIGAIHRVSRQVTGVCEFHDRVCRANDDIELA